MKRGLLLLAVLLCIGLPAAVFWRLADLPPPQHYLRFGPSPNCRPTGRRMTIEGIEFAEIGSGIFRMGSHHLCEEGDLVGKLAHDLGLDWGVRPEHRGDECPTRWVALDSFWIAVTELTNEQYARFDPLHFWTTTAYGGATGNTHPRGDVSFVDAVEFCTWLSGQTGTSARLPSEAQWECACRGGTDTEYSFGDDPSDLGRYSAFRVGSREGATLEAGSFQPNAWGLHDMHGGVWEMCVDTCEVSDGPVYRVTRGGSRNSHADGCRSSVRGRTEERLLDREIGFRPVFSVPDTE